ncbi:MAG: T9SS type A sorting domain-containing protein [Bacteroidetes bacterium]|nr:T9SS type A sorting domain-containing protein [Bacteroidota bacterium]
MKSFIITLVLTFCLSVNAQIINTIAGSGNAGYSGDGGLAINAELNLPAAICSDTAGNIYFADALNHCVRKINQNGIITTIAGIGVIGYSGDGGLAVLAELSYPYGVCVDVAGNIYISVGNRVRKVDTNGIITTIAGNGTSGFSGDGGLATFAELKGTANIAVDNIGNIFIADMNNSRIRKVDINGIISTVAGNGTVGYSGDGGQAVAAQLGVPAGVGVDKEGNLFIADRYYHCIRKINTNGTITTIAGTGISGYSGDYGLAALAQLYFPTALDVDTLGNIYIVDELNSCIRKIDTSGIITTIAGTGTWGISDDGGEATNTALYYPKGMTYIDGRIYISDSQSNRIRIFCENKLEITASPNSICTGEATTLSISGASSYTWSTNESAANISVTPVDTTTYAVNAIDNYGCQNKAQIRVSVSPCTSVDELENGNDELKVYPNPANEMLNVELEMKNESAVEIYVYNILGNVILNENVNIENNVAQINVSALKSGMYFIKIGNATQKFVKE